LLQNRHDAHTTLTPPISGKEKGPEERERIEGRVNERRGKEIGGREIE